MNAIEAIFKRRSVKQYDPIYKISPEDEKKLFEATIQAPTSFNIQHWRFIVVRDPAIREKIRKEYGNDQAQMTDASLLIIFTADVKAWKKDPARYWQNAPKEVADLLVGWMGPFHEGREWLQRDEAQRSIGMAMQTLMVTVKDTRSDSCPTFGFDTETAAGLINLPEDHVMGPMVAIGKGIKEASPKAGQLPLKELVKDNTF